MKLQQVTKLFGINYDTPTNIQIHTSASQLSAPGSYMLAPSYSEALLMDPLDAQENQRMPLLNSTASRRRRSSEIIIPSYSEAFLFERAVSEQQSTTRCLELLPNARYSLNLEHETCCECPCHSIDHNRDNSISIESVDGQLENSSSNNAFHVNEQPSTSSANAHVTAAPTTSNAKRKKVNFL